MQKNKAAFADKSLFFFVILNVSVCYKFFKLFSILINDFNQMFKLLQLTKLDKIMLKMVCLESSFLVQWEHNTKTQFYIHLCKLY